MSLSWDSIKWLKKNYQTDNLAIKFFIAGSYLSTQQHIAENEFKESVQLINDYHDVDEDHKDHEICSWAKNVIDCNFRIIFTVETNEFWMAGLLSGNIRRSINEFERYKFVNSGANTFCGSVSGDSSSNNNNKKRAHEDSPNKRITTSESDAIFLDGLPGSLFSYLKIKTSEHFGGFDTFDNKEKYFATITMNNVCDLTDNTIESQLYYLTAAQIQQLNNILTNTKEKSTKYVDNIKECFSKISSNDIGSLLAKVNSFIFSSSKNDIAVSEVYRSIFRNHFLSSELFSETRLANLSEFDYILSFWGPVIKDIFIGSDIWTHWGDTESLGCPYKFRMDVRLLCDSFKKSYDHGAGEFARSLTESKYYNDKRKLILNGIIQLNNVLKTYNGDSKDLKLPFFQVLGFQGHINCLYRLDSKYYVVEKVCTFEYPYKKKNIITEASDFVDKLLLLKNLVSNFEEYIQQASENRKKSIDHITSFSPASSSISTPSVKLWFKP